MGVGYKIIIGCGTLSVIQAMRKTLTIRTISFKDAQSAKEEELLLHATCRLFSRTETLNTERQSLASKLTKGASEKHYNKRLSMKNSQRLSLKGKDKVESKRQDNKVKSRYDQSANCEQQQIASSLLSSHHFHRVKTLNEPSDAVENQKSSDSTKISKMRIKSQPNTKEQKKQLIDKVTKKIELMRKMTIEGDMQATQTTFVKSKKQQDNTKLYNFDKMYDYCLKKLNRDINRYEKNVDKLKDKKYYELKFESGIISKELLQMRKNMGKKVEDEQNQTNMGIVGNLIDLAKSKEKNGFKMGKKKLNTDKRLPSAKNGAVCNPFTLDTRGWQDGDKQEFFYLCE